MCAIQVRVPTWLYEDLSAEAEENGRSLSAQAERRLLYRESHLTRLVGALVEESEKRLRSRGEDDETLINAECRRVAHVAVEVFYNGLAGPTDDEIDALTRIKIPQSQLDQHMDDAWAPFLLAEFKKRGAKPPD